MGPNKPIAFSITRRMQRIRRFCFTFLVFVLMAFVLPMSQPVYAQVPQRIVPVTVDIAVECISTPKSADKDGSPADFAALVQFQNEPWSRVGPGIHERDRNGICPPWHFRYTVNNWTTSTEPYGGTALDVLIKVEDENNPGKDFNSYDISPGKGRYYDLRLFIGTFNPPNKYTCRIEGIGNRGSHPAPNGKCTFAHIRAIGDKDYRAAMIFTLTATIGR